MVEEWGDAYHTWRNLLAFLVELTKDSEKYWIVVSSSFSRTSPSNEHMLSVFLASSNTVEFLSISLVAQFLGSISFESGVKSSSEEWRSWAYGLGDTTALSFTELPRWVFKVVVFLDCFAFLVELVGLVGLSVGHDTNLDIFWLELCDGRLIGGAIVVLLRVLMGSRWIVSLRLSVLEQCSL
ncbi:hypothetical protein QQP08_022090 [Theobroma cacao]|nr:hypothetical protein QQP08_022090 [Theobroma cacao]